MSNRESVTKQASEVLTGEHIIIHNTPCRVLETHGNDLFCAIKYDDEGTARYFKCWAWDEVDVIMTDDKEKQTADKEKQTA
jgi:hypothetical protein